MENRIKECQLDLFADRTSAASLGANQLRLCLLRGLAYCACSQIIGAKSVFNCLALGFVVNNQLKKDRRISAARKSCPGPTRRTVRTEVVMRFLSLKTGLLLALVPLALAFAAGEEQDDKSYLPPSSLRGKPEEAPAALDKAPATVMREASIDRGKHARVVQRRHNTRYSSRRRPGLGFLFPVLAERIIGGVA